MRAGIVLVFLFCILPTVTALGLSYEYLEENTLKLAPGETYYFKLILQNEQDEEITVNITLKSDIATLVGERLNTLPPKTYDKYVYFNITVPADVAPGTEYSVGYTVVPLEKRGGGQVPFMVRYDRSVRVLTVQKEAGPIIEAPNDLPAPKSSLLNSPLLTIFLVICILGLVVFVWKKSASMSKRVVPPMQEEPKVPKKNHQEHHHERKHAPAHRLAHPEKVFILHGGGVLRSIRELRDALHTMSDETYNYHEKRNDFSNWTLAVLELPELAEKMHNLSKEEMEKLLDHELR